MGTQKNRLNEMVLLSTQNIYHVTCITYIKALGHAANGKVAACMQRPKAICPQSLIPGQGKKKINQGSTDTGSPLG